MNQLAKELRLSPSTLTKKFRAEVGSPLGTYIDTMLFRKCMHLLLSTDLPIGKIAEELEFCDQFYFSRFFKQHYGEAPHHLPQAPQAGLKPCTHFCAAEPRRVLV